MKKQDERFVIICLFLFAFFATRIECANQKNVSPQEQKERDLIEKLPGQPPVSFKQYGGYVTVDEIAGRAFYYYLAETTSTNASAPLVLWLNGGPCSSSLGNGGMQGLGPFRVHSDGKTLWTNPYSWNTVANLLLLETPAEVGFSYTNTSSDLDKANDKRTAADNFNFLVKWLDRFPEYKEREFYIAGESYAGHYIPQLAKNILRNNNKNKKWNKNKNKNKYKNKNKNYKTFINLQGLFIGNPTIDVEMQEDDKLDFYATMGMVSQEYIANYKSLCIPFSRLNETTGPMCGGLSMKIFKDIENVDDYNVYARLCLNKTLTIHPKTCVSIENFDPCSEHYVDAYMNMKEVQKVMHTKSKRWVSCNMDVNDRYKSPNSVIRLYKQLIDKDSVRMLVYSGDLDAVIPAKATMRIMRSLNVTVEETWRAWYDGREVGGYVEKYKGKSAFATVKGSGHMVPSSKTKALLTLITSFMSNTPLPKDPTL